MVDRKRADELERELLRRIAARDHSALGELYDQLAGVLFSTALHILGDRSEAEEVLQDVFVQIWTKAATFDSALGAPFHWALGIVRNRSIDRLRSRQRRARVLDQATIEAGDAASEAPATSGIPIADELAAVRKAVAALPPEQHRVIAMAFFGGMTHTEIAEALNEPLGTIKARIRRGMLSLRDTLKGHVC